MSAHLFIVSAPSGAGKSSLVSALLDIDPGVRVSVSHTTRATRKGEVDGREYHFVDRTSFQKIQQQNGFLESAEVYGNLYGTAKSSLLDLQAKGFDVVLEIDWQGARQVRQLFPASVGIFILPPSLEALRERLEKRGQDSPAVVERRLSQAREDISHVADFEYVIINQDFTVATQDLVAIVRATRCRRSADGLPDGFRTEHNRT